MLLDRGHEQKLSSPIKPVARQQIVMHGAVAITYYHAMTISARRIFFSCLQLTVKLGSEKNFTTAMHA
jgi:hypothetical protein